MTMAEQFAEAGQSAPGTQAEKPKTLGEEYELFAGVADFWTGDDKMDRLSEGISQEVTEFKESPMSYLKDTGKNLLGGTVHGLGELAGLAELPSQVAEYGVNKLFSLGGEDDIIGEGLMRKTLTDAGKGMAEDVQGPAFTTGDILGPPVGTAIKHAPKVGSGINTLMSKATKPVINKATEMLTRTSPRGTIRDTFKSNFVQDYRLGDEYIKYLDEAESGVREIDTKVNSYMSQIKEQLTPGEQASVVRYMDGTMTPDELRVIETTEPHTLEAMQGISARIEDNTMKLVDLKMLDNTVTEGRKTDTKYLKRVFAEEGHQPQKFTDIDNTYMSKDSRGLNVNVDNSRLFNNADEVSAAGFTDTGNKTPDGKSIWNRQFTNEEYAKLGSVEDLATRTGATLESQGQDLVKGRFYDKILNESNIKTFDTPEEGMVRLEKDYGSLTGKYVDPEVKSSLDQFSGLGDRHTPEAWRKYVNEWKANVVIKNPKSHVNNVIGNITMSWYGDVPVSNALKGAGHAAKAATDNNYIKTMNNYPEAAEVGLFGRTSLDEMINQVTGIESRFKPQNLPGNMNKSNLYLGKDSKWGKPIYDAYRNEDDAFKLSNYNYFRGKGLSPEASRKKVELAIFDYAKQMPKGLNYLRDTGMIPFVSWQYKSIPLLADTLANNPAKLAGTTAALYGMNAIFDGDNEAGSGKVKVGNRNISSQQWTPYQEYLNAQKTGASFLFGGLPQNILGTAVGKDMSFGSPRAITRSSDDKAEGALKYGKKATDLLPIPGVYKALFRTGKDVFTKDRNVVESAIDRIFIGNKPPRKKSRNRKNRPSRRIGL